nr:putative reverse transcriptase domain-containing protein [Tanacetum cinerariifolium]
HPGECRRAAGTYFKCGQAGHLQKDCKKNTTASTSCQADKNPVHRVVFSPSLRIMLLRPQEFRHPGECRRAAGTCFKCGQAGHLQKDCKKNTTASTSSQADKKPGASGRVFATTEDHATKTSGSITGTLFIYRHAVFVLFDTSATHSVISSVFASRVTTTPTLLDHVLCISTPMQDSIRITHVYRNLLLQFDDKIRAINAFPLDMCEFDIILGVDWLTEHHATIDCRSYRVIFGDIHAPEFIYHGTLPGKSMQIISALQA